MFFKKLLQEIKDVVIPLYKILIPFVFIIKLLEITGIVSLVAKVFAPLMGLIGLPPELGIIWVTASVVNIYAALILFADVVGTLFDKITLWAPKDDSGAVLGRSVSHDRVLTLVGRLGVFCHVVGPYSSGFCSSGLSFRHMEAL